MQVQGSGTSPYPWDVGCASWFVAKEYSVEKRGKGAFQWRSLTATTPAR